MTVYNDILEWSKNIPLWQQDALRRIIVNGNLTDEDYHELETLCRYNSGAETPNEPPELKPLAEHHLNISDSSNDTIALSSLRHIEGVNALARDQLLSFGNSGLTVIYGPNGSGKSTLLKNINSNSYNKCVYLKSLLILTLFSIH